MAIVCNTKVQGDVGELLAKLVSQTEEAIVCVECANHTVVLYNHGAERLFGYEAEEILGEYVENILPIQKRKDSRVLTTGTRKDGSKFPLELTITTVDLNNQEYCAVIARPSEAAKTAELEEYRKTTKRRLLKEIGAVAEMRLAGRS